MNKIFRLRRKVNDSKRTENNERLWCRTNIA